MHEDIRKKFVAVLLYSLIKPTKYAISILFVRSCVVYRSRLTPVHSAAQAQRRGALWIDSHARCLNVYCRRLEEFDPQPQR